MLAAIDSNALTYLVDSSTPGYDPDADETSLGCERTAMLRAFLYADVRFWVGPQVVSEYNRIRDKSRHLVHEQTVWVLLDEGGVDLDDPAVATRALNLREKHSGESDCRIVAEAEARKCDRLLTCDDNLIKRLDGACHIPILRPSEFWADLGIPRGVRMRNRPADSNPLSDVKWWKW